LVTANYLKKLGLQGKYTISSKGYATEKNATARRVEITIRSQ
jgi:hypothetical protein